MSTQRLRVGLAGAGWVSEHHLDAWGTLEKRAIVVAIADVDADAAQARADAYAIANAYNSVEAMLAEAQLDAIDIATPVETHVEIARSAVNNGVAILCQKPLAPTVAGAELLIAEIADRVPFMVHENWRFRPHYRQIHSWLTEGRIGNVTSAAMSVLSSGLLPDAHGALPALLRQPNLASLERMLLMEILIHHVDTLRFLLGNLKLSHARLRKRSTAIRGEDEVTLRLTAQKGVPVTLVGDYMAPGYPAQAMDHLEMHGTEGSIYLSQDELRLTGEVEEVVPLDLAANYKASYRNAITHFLDGLASGSFETSPLDNLETLKIVEAAYLNGRSRSRSC